MIDKILELVKSKYPLQSLDAGEFAKMKISGMHFDVSAYRAEGFGHVSVMQARGFFGLMKMDSLIIVPTEKELPLFSCERIRVMKKDILIAELYDTLSGAYDGGELDAVKGRYSGIPDHDTGVHWYDNIRLPQSFAKEAKHTAEFDNLESEYIEAYLRTENNTGNREEKRRKTEYYVQNLLKNGGPATDPVKEKLGEEKTKELFEKVLFGIGL